MTAVTIDVPTGYVAVIAKAATCHPDRPVCARNLCKNCYNTARLNGAEEVSARLQQHRPVAIFADEYEALRTQGLTIQQIAERLGVCRESVYKARRRAIAKGLLTPDRRAA